MNKYKYHLENILNKGYGVRSGVYSAIDSSIKMELDTYGEYQPIFSGDETEDTFKRLLEVDSMSSYSTDEQYIADSIFKKTNGIKYDSLLGYYTGLYTGYVKEGKFRERGSSGGFTTWILAELLDKGHVDGIIHASSVDPKKENGVLFKYVISRSKKDLQKGSKSYYYPMELSQVLQVVKDNPGNYAVVAIPEFITELRLLTQVDPVMKERLKFMIGLVCGHQKTAKYAEALAWQHGIKPGDLSGVDFRVKQPESTALDYLHRFTGFKDGEKVSFTKSHAELFAENWATGFFKSKFSDFTDNTFNETADVTLGDAWIPECNKDGMGTNILIVRDLTIATLLREAERDNRINLIEASEDLIKSSQQGLIHHTRDELPYRLMRHSSAGWTPEKRTKPSFEIPKVRRDIQDIRYRMAVESSREYKKAVDRGDWTYFELKMTKLLDRYSQLYRLEGRRSRWRISNLNNYFVRLLVDKIRKKGRIRTRLKVIKAKLRVRTRLRQFKNDLVARKVEQRVKKADGAIVTVTGYYNYGSIIQRWALQRFLQLHNYNFLVYSENYKEPLVNTDLPDFEKFINTADFVEKRIWRKPFDDKDDFPVYITGSDQVWRNWSYQDEANQLGYYFLNFVNNPKAKRIAYAASFGQDTIKKAGITGKFIKDSQALINKFDAISVREESGVEIVKKHWNQNAEHVVDPTMLVSMDEYSRLIDNSPYTLHDTGQVFSYILAIDDSNRGAAKRIAKESKLNLEEFYPKDYVVLPPVEQWLKGFRDAELVITDSFHGTVFAIINKTPFVVIENTFGGSARLTSLLEAVGLDDRLISADARESFKLKELRDINWDDVSRRLNVLREHSADWLLATLAKPPSPKKRVKVVALIPYKFDADYIPDLKKNLEGLVDDYIIQFDKDGDLMKNEGKYRTAMIHEAEKKGADWVVLLDPDERFERDAVKKVRQWLESYTGEKVMFEFNFRELYSPDQYRMDGVWNEKKRIPVFPILPENKYSEAKIHAQKHPLNDDYRVINTGLNIYHLKHIRPELRQQRRDLYNKLDPERKNQPLGYDYLVDESGMQLKKIDRTRMYSPNYRNYKIDSDIYKI